MGAGSRRRRSRSQAARPFQRQVLGGIDGHTLLLIGLVFCVLGLLFGLAIYTKLKNLPVHQSMLEISELIYETCKTYLTRRASSS